MQERELEILISHGRIALPPGGGEGALIDRATLATLVANLTHYGYALTQAGFSALAAAPAAVIEDWWLAVEGALMTLTGDDKDMAAHVVYKNFPAEVLAMDESDYWLRQILMYWGLPNELVTEAEAPREPLDEGVELKVLQPGGADALVEIYRALLRLPARWTPGQWEQVHDLIDRCQLEVSEVPPFKENLITLAAALLERGVRPPITTATDTLRLAIAMSGGDVSMATNSKLRKFTRKERRALLELLEQAPNLAEDVARRRERFKRLLQALHPGDYAARFVRVVEIYDRLYRGASIETFEVELERLLAARDPGALTLLATRPGVFARRLHHCLLLFGADAAGAFTPVMAQLKTIQLVKLLTHFRGDHSRRFRTFPPRGNWIKMQTRPTLPRRKLAPKLREGLVRELEAAIARRVRAVVPSVRLDPRTRWIKLQTNDSELSPYGRGTRFPLPASATFIRTASYWKSGPTRNNLWYDNGWTFFDGDWKPAGVCCWDRVHDMGEAAVFSGDPTNSKDLDGRACQLIDLYPARLAKKGVRYAVWNILCFSRRTFNQAQEVFAALQWGIDPQAGKLFEPARCQLAFPVRGESLTKYVAYLDLRERQLIYMDANLWANVRSAGSSTKVLAAIMPAFVEYLDALPSVHDLFAGLPASEQGMCVAYDDADLKLEGERAYVFRPRNQDNAFEPFDTSAVLG